MLEEADRWRISFSASHCKGKELSALSSTLSDISVEPREPARPAQASPAHNHNHSAAQRSEWPRPRCGNDRHGNTRGARGALCSAVQCCSGQDGIASSLWQHGARVCTSAHIRVHVCISPFILASCVVVSLLLERSTDSSLVIEDQTSAEGNSVISLPSS